MRATNPVEQRVIALLEPAAEELGYRLVRVRLSGLRRKRLQIMAEREDGRMDVDDCARFSRAASALLDAHDVIADAFDLEVSSPGIDRPLMRLEDFARFTGHEAKLETAAMIDGRKRFRGVLAGVAGGNVRLVLPEGEIELPFAALADARLVLTDKLIEEDLRRAKAQQRNSSPVYGGGGERSEPEGGASPLSQSAARPDSSPAGGGANPQKRKVQ